MGLFALLRDGEVEESYQQQPELEGSPQRHQAPAPSEGHRREGNVPEVPSQPAFRQEEQCQEAGELREIKRARGRDQLSWFLWVCKAAAGEGTGHAAAGKTTTFVRLQTDFECKSEVLCTGLACLMWMLPSRTMNLL